VGRAVSFFAGGHPNPSSIQGLNLPFHMGHRAVLAKECAGSSDVSWFKRFDGQWSSSWVGGTGYL